MRSGAPVSSRPSLCKRTVFALSSDSAESGQMQLDEVGQTGAARTQRRLLFWCLPFCSQRLFLSAPANLAARSLHSSTRSRPPAPPSPSSSLCSVHQAPAFVIMAGARFPGASPACRRAWGPAANQWSRKADAAAAAAAAATMPSSVTSQSALARERDDGWAHGIIVGLWQPAGCLYGGACRRARPPEAGQVRPVVACPSRLSCWARAHCGPVARPGATAPAAAAWQPTRLTRSMTTGYGPQAAGF